MRESRGAFAILFWYLFVGGAEAGILTWYPILCTEYYIVGLCRTWNRFAENHPSMGFAFHVKRVQQPLPHRGDASVADPALWANVGAREIDQWEQIWAAPDAGVESHWFRPKLLQLGRPGISLLCRVRPGGRTWRHELVSGRRDSGRLKNVPEHHHHGGFLSPPGRLCRSMASLLAGAVIVDRVPRDDGDSPRRVSLHQRLSRQTYSYHSVPRQRVARAHLGPLFFHCSKSTLALQPTSFGTLQERAWDRSGTGPFIRDRSSSALSLPCQHLVPFLKPVFCHVSQDKWPPIDSAFQVHLGPTYFLIKAAASSRELR